MQIRTHRSLIRHLARRAAIAVATLLLLAMAACGGSSSKTTTAGIAVTISPTTASVLVGKTQQFTATVTGATNNAVTWQVNGTTGGNVTIGTISTSGLYTAPATPTAAAVTITAVSQQDTTAGASASVLVTLPITVSPNSANVTAGSTQQFTATVNISTTNTGATWSVNGVAGGDSTHGTVDANGLYTAPATIPNPGTVTVTAAAKADPTQTASATVHIVPPPLVISPTAVTLPAGTQQAFTATASNAAATPAWSLRCQSTVPGACGTIDASGVFTAPLSPPPGGTVTIVASMPDGSALPASTTALIQFGNASLIGQYAFAFQNRTPQAFAAEAGSVTFDGNGAITGGAIDTGSVSSTITGGTYTIGVDGRGSALLTTDKGFVPWQFSLVDHNRAFAVRINASGVPVSGTLDLQVPSKFAGVPVAGTYTLSLSGFSAANNAPFGMVGSITAGAGAISGGVLDVNNNTVITSNATVTGSFTLPAGSGRGTLSLTTPLGTQTFVYYQVDDTRLELVETDRVRIAGGELVKQAAGPFTNASIAGRYAFTESGVSGGAFKAAGGVFTFSGAGGVTNRVLDGVNQTVFDTQGGYGVTDALTGRTTANWTVNNGQILQYVFYPRNDGSFAVLETDATIVATGIARPQTLAAPSVSSLVGTFALAATGTRLPSTSGQLDATGNAVLTAATTFTGTLDLATGGTTTQGTTLSAGLFAVDPNTGRGTAGIQPVSGILPGGTLIIYVLDANHALLLESDSNAMLTGTLIKQF